VGWSIVQILLVDDDPQVGEAVAELLRSAGHQVTVCLRGSLALSATLTHDFDMMICDVMLPDMPGIEIIRAVKAQAPQLPVVVLSGSAPEQWQKDCEDAGAACFLSKPLAPTELLREVSLISKARLSLRVALVDRDRIHRTRLTKTLGAMGCTIRPFASAQEAMDAIKLGEMPSLWVADATDPNILDLLNNVKTDRVPVFVFSAEHDVKQEETLMRVGAALFLSKPIDIDTLLTQASFLAR
jgi:DNA-binding response OmpR family regulator